ncbi:uncharacterized protein LOC107821094 [Nicotiana tabacum]|uniref:Uncharacterized protein LOC107821094 n=2 Tax=Nicotiana tabacum TaxID=4097 RepID=A0A1S4CNZ8_TOBAC|nr:PREDICTED: uncharacterized protein LOC107821094 [Nicotiana tabacum]
MPEGVRNWITRLRSLTADQIEWILGWLPVDEIVHMPATGPYFLLMGLRSIQPYAPYRILRQLGRCQIVPKDEDLITYVVEICSDAQFSEDVVRQIWSECWYLGSNTRVHDLSKGEVEPGYAIWYGKRVTMNNESERPAKRPHVQEFVDTSQEQWAWVAKEKDYWATISKLENQARAIKFESGLQAAEDEGEKKRLAQENEALRAQLREMRIAVEMPVRSERDQKIIGNLRQKVHDYATDLTKAEKDLAKARARMVQLGKDVEEQTRLARQAKQSYNKEVAILRKELATLENEMGQQVKDFKTEREHCYALINKLEENVLNLQNRNNMAMQVVEVREQQIGRLLQEKGAIKLRIKK